MSDCRGVKKPTRASRRWSSPTCWWSAIPTQIDERGVRQAPDWVPEVLSAATAAHDQITKRQLYERTGVREYWLVHPTDRIVTVHRLENGC